MTKARSSIVVAALALGTVACRGGGIAYHLRGQPGVKTLVNLHPDEQHARLYSTNYLRGGLIPRCSEVTINAINKKAMKFTLVETGRTYTWLFQRKLMVEPIPEHLDKFFGTECDEAEVRGLSQIDQQGIKEGRVYEGMSRRGVLLAVGPPPTHETPNLEMDSWKYWQNRFDTILVHFQGDTVVTVED